MRPIEPGVKAVGELLEPGMRHPEALVERPFRAGPVPLVPPPGAVLAESQDGDLRRRAIMRLTEPSNPRVTHL